MNVWNWRPHQKKGNFRLGGMNWGAKSKTIANASCLFANVSCLFLPATESEGGIWGKTLPEFSESEIHQVNGHLICPDPIWHHSREFVFVDAYQKYILSDASLDPIYVKMNSLAWKAFIVNGCILNLDPSDPLKASLSHVYLAARRVLCDFENGNSTNYLEWISGHWLCI